MLSEGQGRRNGPGRGVCHQGEAVSPLHLVPQGGEHRLVAAHLHVPAEEHPAKPHCRVPPVHRQDAPGQELPPGVPAADVVALMDQDAGALRAGKMGRDVDPGPEKAQDKGGGHRVGLPHLAAAPHRPGQAAPQAHQADNPYRQHRQKPQQPHHRGRPQQQFPLGEARSLRQGGQGVFHRAGNTGGYQDRGVRRRAGRGHGRRHRRQGCHHAAVHGAGGLRQVIEPRQVENTQKPPEAHRTEEPEPHHQPQGIAVLPGCPGEGQPHRQHHPHHRQGHEGHGEEPGKNRRQKFHAYPS